MSPDLHHLSGAYAVDALDDAERAAFEQHLAGCADCRAEVAELSAAAQSLASLTEAGPPPSLRAAVVSGIAAVRPLPPLGADAGEPAPALVSEPASSGADETTAAQTSATGLVADGPATVPDAGADVVPIPRRRTAWFAAAAAAAVIVIGGLAWSPWSDDTGPASPMAQSSRPPTPGGSAPRRAR